jgi:phage replication-related protein YjqB (UPF0714/DUF867 family)
MIDVYASFADLAAQEIEGLHYQIHIIDRDARTLILAPHGGHIEPGTLQIGKALAGNCYSFYGFESLEKRLRTANLHITSSRFDEPRALELLHRADLAISVHGRKDKEDADAIWVGGLHERLRDRLVLFFNDAAIPAKAVGAGHSLSGRDPKNICNRGRFGAGVQFEIPARLRQKLVMEQKRLSQFTEILHHALQQEPLALE